MFISLLKFKVLNHFLSEAFSSIIFVIYSVPFYAVAIYVYYHGIIDHSGINFKAQWWQPWQPDAEFHDQHHEFFHCNFGFNMSIWDKVSSLIIFFPSFLASINRWFNQMLE